MVLYLALLLPLAWASLSFFDKQGQFHPVPQAPSLAVVRGSILDRDGRVLAEGDAEARRYPQREIAAHVVGFSGAKQGDGRYGLEGLEHTLDDRLQQGESIRTTLDLSLQSSSQESLRQVAQSYQAESGAAIVLQAGTGQILAAASYPEFDPNHYRNYEDYSYLNRPFMQVFDPGSVFKPMVVAAALESKLIDPQQVFNVPMEMTIGSKRFSDVLAHGPQLVTGELLKYSSNVGMIQVAAAFRSADLYWWLEDFGFGRTPPLRKLFVKDGVLRSWEKWVPQDQAALAIGQGVNVSLLQLALAYSVFANEGFYIPPSIILGEAPGEQRRVVSVEVANEILGMLVATAEYGSARNALVPGVKIAGKTGTADAFDSLSRQYRPGDYNTCFAGIFPADAPKAIAVVCLQNPKGKALWLNGCRPYFPHHCQ
ncbi:MAG: penicillin-binding transpeptidase domain-containing protein [Deinococcales bacterium]